MQASPNIFKALHQNVNLHMHVCMYSNGISTQKSIKITISEKTAPCN